MLMESAKNRNNILQTICYVFLQILLQKYYILPDLKQIEICFTITISITYCRLFFKLSRCEAYFISELDKTLWSIKPVVWKKEEEKNTRKSADKNTL